MTMIPPNCEKHNRLMTLSLFHVPGNPNPGWVCLDCLNEDPIKAVNAASKQANEALFVNAPAPIHPREERFYEISKENCELHRKKSADYGNGEDPFANVMASSAWGVEPWVGVMIRVNDKLKRLQSLIQNGKLENESAIDSFRDIATYTQMAQVLFEEYLERQQPKITTNGPADHWAYTSPTLGSIPLKSFFEARNER